MGRTFVATAIAGFSIALPISVSAGPDPEPANGPAASGYGIEVAAALAASAGEEKGAVEECFAAIEDKLDGPRIKSVTLAAVNRAHRGSEGWITDVTVDVTRKKRGGYRRDFICRAGEHGLHLARY